MNKNVLIAVDTSANTNRVLDYAARISSMVQELGYTLMYVQPPISQFMSEDAKRDAKVYTELNLVRNKNQKAAQDILERCKERMVQKGIKAEHIELYTKPRKLGVARDILEKAEVGLYDAVLVARRGLSRAQQIFMGSVSNQIVNNAVQIPVWIIDGDIKSMKILVPVDGSAISLRSVDHLAFMVGGNPEAKVVFFHVTPKLADYCTIDFNEQMAPDLETAFLEQDQQCIDNFYAKAQIILHDVGLTDEQIEIKVKTTTWGVARAIREEVKRGHYGTVVIGRSGMHKSAFMGTISSKVIQSLNNCALWVTT